MNKKDMFVDMVEKLISLAVDGGSDALNDDAIAYFEAFKSTQEKVSKPDFTDNGKLILKSMQDNETDRAGMFSAKQIAEYAFISSRSVSGSIRKLVNDGYVEKIGKDPIIYTLTEKGRGVNLSEQ